MEKRIAFASFNIALAVGLGALGAHFLKAELSVDSLASFETGVRYHFFHGLALMVVLCLPLPYKSIKGAWLAMAVGMIMFSFSIYGLSTCSLFGLEGSMRWLGPVTPLGGVLLISSWLWLGVVSLLSKRGSGT